MINTVCLEPDGILTAEDRGDAGAVPIRLLSSRVILTRDYTLRSFFRMLEAYPVFMELNAFLPELRRRYRECPAGECSRDAIDTLEFGKTIEMIGFPGNPQLEIYSVLQGVVGEKTVEIKPYDIGLLLDTPVTLGKLRHIIFGDPADSLEFDTVYTLFEFIDGIAWALSFHNAPEQCGIGR